MNILLFSVPDSFEHMPAFAIRLPNGALTSLAGNVDPYHRVAVADLILVQDGVRQTVERLVRELAPDVVGLSVMTFQRRTAHKLIDLVRQLRPAVQVVVGGYDPSLAPDGCSRDTAPWVARSTWSRPPAAVPSIAASARSSRCAVATSTPMLWTGCWPTSATHATMAPVRSSSLMTT